MSLKAPTSGSTGKKNGSPVSTSASLDSRDLDPLTKAQARLQAAREANNLLLDAADWDEDTGRTEVTVNLANHPSPPQPSQPQIEVSQPEPGVFKIAFTAVKQLHGGWLAAVLIAVAAMYTFLKWSGKL